MDRALCRASAFRRVGPTSNYRPPAPGRPVFQPVLRCRLGALPRAVPFVSTPGIPARLVSTAAARVSVLLPVLPVAVRLLMLRMGGSLTARRGFVGSLMAVVLVAGCFVLGASRLYWPVHAGDDGAVGATSAQSEAVSMGFMADAGHPVQTPEPSLLSRAATVRSSSLAAADVPAPPARLDAAASGQTQVLQVGQQLVVTLGPGWSRPRAQTPPSDAGSAIQPLRTDPLVRPTPRRPPPCSPRSGSARPWSSRRAAPARSTRSRWSSSLSRASEPARCPRARVP